MCELTFIGRDCLEKCLEPWEYIVEWQQSHLDWIPNRVHWIRNVLTTKPKLFSAIIWCHIGNENTSSSQRTRTVSLLKWFQCKVEKGQFDNKPSRNYNSGGTIGISRKIIWKIWTCQESTSSIKVFSTFSCKKKKPCDWPHRKGVIFTVSTD